MYTFTLKRLLGLAIVGIIWTVSGETSLNSSASSDRNTTSLTRERREQVDIMTNEERKQFLDMHNNIRRDMTKALKHEQPTAANMMRMYWNALLEAGAVSWSKTMCDQSKFDHGQPADFKNQLKAISYLTPSQLLNVGQNIYKAGDKSASVVITAYANETFLFQYDAKGYGPCTVHKCGHYTQVVWHDSFLVGCGYASCGKSYYSTCNYLLAGNWPKPPYTAGTPCSLCASDKAFNFKECEENLCVPSDRCAQVTECQVVDRVNCLCAESSYKEFVGNMVKTLDARTIHAGPPVIVYGLLLPLVAILLGQ